MYVHRPNGHTNGVLDPATESFVNESRSSPEPAAVVANGSIE